MLQEAQEYRGRKAQLAKCQQEQHAFEAPVHGQSASSPGYGSAETSWWPGERVIGGGSWSQLPRWRPDFDSNRPLSTSSQAPARPESMQHMQRQNMSTQQESSQQAPASHRHQSPLSRASLSQRCRPASRYARQGEDRRSRDCGHIDRPGSAPSLLASLPDTALPAQSCEDSKKPTSYARHPSTQTTGPRRIAGAKHSSKHCCLSPLMRANGGQQYGQQHRSGADAKLGEAQEKFAYVQRPFVQKLPRRPGSVPNFKELHAAWDARLSAAKAAMQRHLTVPHVSS